MTQPELPPRVFVSYAHDSPEHKELVLRFATFLRVQVGVDVHVDQWYDGRRRDWALWAGEHLDAADFVLVIASPAYRRRADGQAPPYEGRGSQYEAAILRNNITRDLPAETQRVLPVVLPGGSVDDIPTFLCGYSSSHYRIDEFTLDGVEDLLRALSGQSADQLPRRGPYTPIGSRDAKEQQTGLASAAYGVVSAEADTVAIGQARHHTIVVVDVEGFVAPARTLPHQLATRAGLYQAIQDAFQAAGVPWTRCRTEDRGDAIFILVPPNVPKGPLVEVVPEALARAVRVHNHSRHASQQIRLRMAVHAGEVAFDNYGATSTAVTTTFRLLDAPPFKQALRDSSGVVALVVSNRIFKDVVGHSAILQPSTFRPIPVVEKETRTTAWICLPDDWGVPDQTTSHGSNGSEEPTASGTASGPHGDLQDSMRVRTDDPEGGRPVSNNIFAGPTVFQVGDRNRQENRFGI